MAVPVFDVAIRVTEAMDRAAAELCVTDQWSPIAVACIGRHSVSVRTVKPLLQYLLVHGVVTLGHILVAVGVE